tara:strand:- start:768 stop:977 length:210 start_codon:yes stop_codon:yes gene_type:complete
MICTVIGGLLLFYVAVDSYLYWDFLGLRNLPEFVVGMILMLIGYLLYPTELARELLEDTFHFDEDGNLQ